MSVRFEEVFITLRVSRSHSPYCMDERFSVQSGTTDRHLRTIQGLWTVSDSVSVCVCFMCLSVKFDSQVLLRSILCVVDRRDYLKGSFENTQKTCAQVNAIRLHLTCDFVCPSERCYTANIKHK